MCSSNINVLTNLHQRLCISNQLPGDTVLVWGPCFEHQGSNALSNARDSFNPEELRSQSGVPFSLPGSEGEERMGKFPMGWVTLDRLPGHAGIRFVCKARLAAGRTQILLPYPRPLTGQSRSRRCAKNTTVWGLHVCHSLCDTTWFF